MQQPIRVALFDDHSFFIKGLVAFLEQHAALVTVIFTATDKDELEQKLQQEKPDVVVLDVLAPDIMGLELFTALVKQHAGIKLIAYTSLRSALLIETLLSIGVKGYVNKNQPPEDLLQAIEDVYNDTISVPEEYRHVAQQVNKTIKNVFTPRELQILQKIAQGETSSNIGKELGISLRTVENIKVNMFDKLDVKNAAEMILAATRLGYLS